MVRLFSLYIKPTSHGNSTQKYRLPIGRLLVWEYLKLSFPQNPIILHNPCISGEIQHHPSAQLVVLFVVVSSFSRVIDISPSTPCLLLDKFTAPEFRKVVRALSDPFFSPSPSRSCARARARRLCSAAARHRAASY